MLAVVMVCLFIYCGIYCAKLAYEKQWRWFMPYTLLLLTVLFGWIYGIFTL